MLREKTQRLGEKLALADAAGVRSVEIGFGLEVLRRVREQGKSRRQAREDFGAGLVAQGGESGLRLGEPALQREFRRWQEAGGGFSRVKRVDDANVGGQFVVPAEDEFQTETVAMGAVEVGIEFQRAPERAIRSC